MQPRKEKIIPVTPLKVQHEAQEPFTHREKTVVFSLQQRDRKKKMTISGVTRTGGLILPGT